MQPKKNDYKVEIERNRIDDRRIGTDKAIPIPGAGGQDAHISKQGGERPSEKGVAFRGSRQRARRWGSLQASRHTEKVVASRRRPPQIPQVTHGSTTERRTSASAGAPARPPPRARRAEVRRGGGPGGRRAVLPGRGRGPAVVAAAEARRAPCIIADVGRWVRGAETTVVGTRGVY